MRLPLVQRRNARQVAESAARGEPYTFARASQVFFSSAFQVIRFFAIAVASEAPFSILIRISRTWAKK